MGWMIADAKFLLDHHSDTGRDPDLASKPERFGPPCQQLRQLGQLLWRKARRGSWRRTVAQCLWSLAFAFGDPLAHRPFSHTQSDSNVFLFPSLLIQFPGAQASSFAPVFWKRCVFTHTSFHRFAELQTLGLCSEINNYSGDLTSLTRRSRSDVVSEVPRHALAVGGRSFFTL